jgi:hypothetical protein
MALPINFNSNQLNPKIYEQLFCQRLGPGGGSQYGAAPGAQCHLCERASRGGCWAFAPLTPSSSELSPLLARRSSARRVGWERGARDGS